MSSPLGPAPTAMLAATLLLVVVIFDSVPEARFVT
jgi:hypothetical protein